MVSPHSSVFLLKIKDTSGCTATMLCNRVRVKDNSKSECFLIMREIEYFGMVKDFPKHSH